MNYCRVTDWFPSGGALGLVAGATIALAGGPASALSLGDVTIGTTSIYDDTLSTAVVPFGFQTLVSSSNSFFDAFFDLTLNDLTGDPVPGATDLLISDFVTLATILSGQAEDWGVDVAADTVSILYEVTETDTSLTTAGYVVAVLDFSNSADLVDPFDVIQLDGLASSVSVFEAAPPVPLPAGAVLLATGLVGFSIARRRQRTAS